MHPRLAVNSLSSASWPLEHDLELYETIGARSVALFFQKLEAAGLDTAIERVRSSGCRVVSVFSVGVTPSRPDRWAKERESLLRMVETAAELSAPEVSLTAGAAGTLAWDETVDALVAALAPVLDIARAQGITIAVEHTLPTRPELGFVHSLRDAIELGRRVGIGAVMECNYCFGERDLEGTIRDGVDVIATVQLAEILGPRIEDEGYESVIRRGMAYLDDLLEDLGA